MSLPLPPSPMMIQSMKSPLLKEKFTKKRFVDYNLLDYLSSNNKKCINDQLRDLDLIRLHTPLKEEVELLNISDYRMNLHIKNDILYLCGGLIGVRFNNEDLNLILNTIKNLNNLWDRLDLYYKTMNSISKKMIIHDNNQLINKDNIESNIDNQELYSNQQSILQFQLLYDDYLQELIIIQDLIKKKQNEIHINDNHDSLKIDIDPESRIGMKMPLWLTTLINKYNLSNNLTDSNATKNNIMNINNNNNNMIDRKDTSTIFNHKKMKLNLGEFSIYLSTLIAATNSSVLSSIDHIQCTSDENDAISILIQASNDCILSLSNSDMDKTCTNNNNTNNISSNTNTIMFIRDKKYWAKRFYIFLSKMTELVNTIKDDSQINLI